MKKGIDLIAEERKRQINNGIITITIHNMILEN